MRLLSSKLKQINPGIIGNQNVINRYVIAIENA